MKILACIKSVPDPEAAIRFDIMAPVLVIDGMTGLRMNRFDEFAVEEAVLIKSRLPGTTIDAVSVGPENAGKAIQRSVGMGADTGIHIVSDYYQSCDAVYVATCISKLIQRIPYDLVLTGIMSEDMMQFQVGPMIAALCHLPWATAVIHETIREDRKTIYVEREIEGGKREMVEMPLPAVLTVQSGINEPRYPSLSNLIRAIDAGVETISADSLGIQKRTAISAGHSYPEKIREGLVLQGTTEEKARSLTNILREKNLL